MSQVAPVTHEVDAYLYYAPVETHPNALVDYDGLDPYWTVASFLIDECDGYLEIETELDGEPATVRLNYSQSGFQPAPEHDVAGDRLYEFDINVQLAGERKVHYNLSPRFDGQRTTDGEQASLAWDHTDHDAGVAVHVQASNVDLDALPTLLPRALQELFAARDQPLYHGYFQQPFGGRIAAIERYVRIRRGMNEKLVGEGATFDRMSSLLSASDGTIGEYTWDNERTKGHHHAVRFGASGAQQLVSHHRYGGQIKSYLPEHPEKFDENDPLYHPKVGVKFVAGRTDSGSVRWSERHSLRDELDERLLSVLTWSDIPTEAGGTTFVPDDHFDAAAAADPVPLHANPLPELEAEQEHALVEAFGAMTDADEDMLRTLVTDGGQHVTDLADRHDRGLSTIYRMLERLDPIVESDDGHVRFVSQKLRSELRAVLESVEQQVATAADRVAQLVEFDVAQSATSAFDRWLSKYAAEFEPPQSESGSPTIRIDTALSRYKSSSAPLLEDVVDELLSAWCDDCRDPRDLRDAKLVAPVDGSHEEMYVGMLH